MAIYLAGDTHELIDIDKVMNYFEEDSLTEKCSKDKDYLIILGDCGAVWDGEENDKEVQHLLNSLPVTVLYVDGNHENFDLLNEYPECEWHGGLVHMISDSIYHLMRGQVFDIEGKKIFTFGGGNSIDKAWRTPKVSWWPEEMPSQDEYEEGLRNLERVNNKVDYILTHTCPQGVVYEMIYDYKEGEEELQMYLQRIAGSVDFKDWYFGHFHMDEDVENYHCLWDKIVKISE
ncbi:MAG: metallophosphoesterase [Lachnospiraceae bacterium]|nr:metallophosphoesterase [Lachnospiraceae bacterium]